MSDSLLLAFAVTAGAGLATGLGAGLGLFAKTTHHRFLALALGFSAGVMLYVSLVEILPKARTFLSVQSGDVLGGVSVVGAFLAGLLLMAFLYRVLPDFEVPTDDITPLSRRTDDPLPGFAEDRQLLKAGVMVALAVALHNFPEGIATFFLTLEDPSVGSAVAVAIAIHNIPEGIAVAIPLYFALKKRGQAFWLALLSGLAEPVGALLGFLLLGPVMSEGVLGILFAVVAGVMVYISVDSLLPAARQYDRGQLAIYGVIAGMAVMAGSLLLFGV